MVSSLSESECLLWGNAFPTEGSAWSAAAGSDHAWWQRGEVSENGRRNPSRYLSCVCQEAGAVRRPLGPPAKSQSPSNHHSSCRSSDTECSFRVTWKGARTQPFEVSTSNRRCWPTGEWLAISYSAPSRSSTDTHFTRFARSVRPAPTRVAVRGRELAPLRRDRLRGCVRPCRLRRTSRDSQELIELGRRRPVAVSGRGPDKQCGGRV